MKKTSLAHLSHIEPFLGKTFFFKTVCIGASFLCLRLSARLPMTSIVFGMVISPTLVISLSYPHVLLHLIIIIVYLLFHLFAGR